MRDSKKKILSERLLLAALRRARRAGRKIVTYNGSFDVLHLGHVRSLEEAKRQGDVLVVLLNSDKSVKLYKGPSKPNMPEKDRAAMLEALSCVDYVTLFDDITPIRILENLRPHVHCNGSDWGEGCVEREVVEKHGGRVHVLRWVLGRSTSKLLKGIHEATSTPDEKAVFLDRDGTLNDNRKGYIHKKEDFRFLPFVLPALRKLSQSPYKIIVISNQSGIGKGYYTKKDADALFSWLKKELHKRGVRIDGTYYCPHVPEDRCSCRKPEIGMLVKASKDFGLNLSKSWLVGDKENDIQAGRNANIKTILVGGAMSRSARVQPNHRVSNMKEAVDIIISSP